MSYGQINYSETVGNSNLTIAEIGCFVTAFCNLLDSIGQGIDPPTLNNFFKNNAVYTYDATDRANDDVTWGSISRYNSNIVVDHTGSGWPNTNFSIVKFFYKSHTGRMVTHFCKVADWQNQIIIDSYDGKTKTPAQYASYYGEPVGFAVYRDNTPAPTPAAPAPTIPSGYDVVKEIAGYPNSNDAANHINQFDTVQAGNYSVFNSAHGMINVTQVVGTPGSWINPSDNIEDAPTPAPAIPEVPAPTPAPVAPTNIEYTKLSTPLDLVTNKQPTKKWDLSFADDAHATSVEDIDSGIAFLAYGKAQRTDGDKPAYFMTFGDFGQADTTGIPTNNHGINTVDLSPAPPQSTETKPDTPVDGESVPVTVKPSSWQASFTAFLSPQEYISNATLPIHDIDDDEQPEPDQELLKGQTIKIGGIFVRDGIKYYRSAKSITDSRWYGIPVVSLTRINPEPLETDTELGNLLEEIGKEAQAVIKHEKAIVAAASANGWLQRLFHRNKK